MRYLVAALLVLTILAGCAGGPRPTGQFCDGRSVLVEAFFEGGHLTRCNFSADSSLEITILPENKPPINPSPWYSFRLNPKQPGRLDINLRFIDGYARYWPKTSTNGHDWQPMDEANVSITNDGNGFSLSVTLNEGPLWISGQELLTSDYYADWLQEFGANDNVTIATLGSSTQGRPIYMLNSTGGEEFVLLMGRQHPPEVTGAIAMRSFVRTVLADNKLANEFRKRYSLLIIPALNPDGIALGHWRHNVGGVDLNRDWGPFTQPETTLVARLLQQRENSGQKIRLMLDFHSTKSNVFYTQADDENTLPKNFAATWLQRSAARQSGIEFTREANHNSGQANAKNYFFTRYGIPSITYELGDATDRQVITNSAPVFAEEMMRLLLEFSPAE